MNQLAALQGENKQPFLRIETLPFLEIPNQSKLFIDYLQNPLKLKKFYPSVVESHQQISERIPDNLKYYQTDRNLLADVLVETNQFFGAQNPTLENIELLRRSETVAVVTGQQAGLFSGALYTIYKALSAVKLAECLRGRGINAVPVFWLAEEDHDFEEVNKTYTLNRKGKLSKTENRPENYKENLPVGLVKFDDSIRKTIEELLENLPSAEFSAELKELLNVSYQPGETFSSGMAKFLTKLFSTYGLIMFSPLNEKLKKLSAPIFAEAIRQSDEIRGQLLARNEELKKEDYHAQVLVEDDFFPFFWIDETGQRLALKKNKQGKIWAKGTNREFELAELIEIAEKTPEKLSPNALMRPVVQDFLLPTVCYFGGGAEIAYFAQNSLIYQILNRPVTPILHRQSLTVVEAGQSRTLKKYHLRINDLFAGLENILPEIVEKYLNPEAAGVFSEAEEKIKDELDRIEKALSAVEPTLAKNLATRRRKILYHIAALQKKFQLAEIRKDEIIHRQIKTLWTALWPHNGLQERTLNVIWFLNRYGVSWMDWVYQEIDLDDHGHRIIYL